MAIENVELLHECSLEHLRMGTERLKEDKKQRNKASRSVKLEKSKMGMTKKKKSDDQTIARAYRPSRSLLPEAVTCTSPERKTYTYN